MASAARILLVLVALALALAPLPPGLVETYYSSGLYPPVQAAITSMSNGFPFALFDILIVTAVGIWLLLTVRDATGRSAGRGVLRWVRVAGRLIVRTITLAAAAYLVFLIVWGFNYRRVPLTGKLQFDATAAVPDAAHALATVSVQQLNALYDAARRDPQEPVDVDPHLSEAFMRAQTMVGGRWPSVPGRPKRTLLDFYFRSAGVDGMTDPFFLETLVVSDLLPFERPFVLAHEWSHLGGITDEGEANFVGWLTCVHGDAAANYSGWLFLFGETRGSLRSRERAELDAMLAPGPRDDLRAIAERIRRSVRPAIANAGWQVYDKYLKANRVESGTASYAEVVRLILGTKFGENWTPHLR